MKIQSPSASSSEHLEQENTIKGFSPLTEKQSKYHNSFTVTNNQEIYQSDSENENEIHHDCVKINVIVKPDPSMINIVSSVSKDLASIPVSCKPNPIDLISPLREKHSVYPNSSTEPTDQEIYQSDSENENDLEDCMEDKKVDKIHHDCMKITVIVNPEPPITNTVSSASTDLASIPVSCEPNPIEPMINIGSIDNPASVPVPSNPQHHLVEPPPSAGPQCYPVEHEVTQNWDKFSANIQSLLSTVNSNIRQEMDLQFCKQIERLTNQSIMKDALGNRFWLEKQIRYTARTPFSNQYGWLDFEYSKLTQVQKQAVDIAHSLIIMLKDDPNMLQETNFIKYRAYCDMISLWKLSIQKYGKIEPEMQLNYIETIQENDTHTNKVCMLITRDDIWFTTKTLICNMNNDSSVLQILNSRKLKEGFAVDIIEIKIFVREDSPINVGILLPILNMSADLEAFLSSDLSHMTQFSGGIASFILEPK